MRAELDSAAPIRAVLAALLAFHAVRVYQFAALRPTDIRDGRLHIGDQVIPPADPRVALAGERGGMSRFEVAGMLGSLSGGRSACRMRASSC